MKFHVLFCVVLVVLTTFFVPESKAAPKSNAREIRTASNLGQFLNNGKKLEALAIENPLLLDLLNYLTWLRDLDLLKVGTEVQEIYNSYFVEFYKLLDFIYSLLKDVGVDTYHLIYQFDDKLTQTEVNLRISSNTFWESVLENPEAENVHENFLIFVSQIQEFVSDFGNIYFAHLSNLVNLSQILLDGDAFLNFSLTTGLFLIRVSEYVNRIKVLLFPPSEIGPDPVDVTIQEFLGFFQYFAQLNMNSVILGGMETIRNVRDLRLNFNKQLLSIFHEASGADSDLENQGRNLTETFQATIDSRRAADKSAWYTFLNFYFNDGGWNTVTALVEYGNSLVESFEQLSEVSLDTIVQLETLIETTASEYQQKANELVAQTLKAGKTLINNYLEAFKPVQ